MFFPPSFNERDFQINVESGGCSACCPRVHKSFCFDFVQRNLLPLPSAELEEVRAKILALKLWALRAQTYAIDPACMLMQLSLSIFFSLYPSILRKREWESLEAQMSSGAKYKADMDEGCIIHRIWNPLLSTALQSLASVLAAGSRESFLMMLIHKWGNQELKKQQNTNSPR